MMVKRVCFFAGYDSDGKIADYVVYYIKLLSRISDVYYFADCLIALEDFEKITPYVKGGWCRRHGGYDFGSWKELIKKIGWEALSEYDELILCNDSCFGPVFPLEPIFDKVADYQCDFWGITEGHRRRRHLQSYFMVFKRSIFLSATFKNFINSIEAADKSSIIDNYESVLTGACEDAGFKCAKLLKGSIGAYDKYRTLLKMGAPFIKKLSFTESDKYSLRQSLVEWEYYFKKYTDYDTELIKSYLRTQGIEKDFYRSGGYKAAAFRYILKRLGKWFWDVRIGKKRIFIKILGVTFFDRHKDSIPSFL